MRSQLGFMRDGLLLPLGRSIRVRCSQALICWRCAARVGFPPAIGIGCLDELRLGLFPRLVL